MELSHALLVYGWIALHVVGLLVGWSTRLTAGQRFDWCVQLVFFGLLAGLSGAAWYSHQQELGLWVPTGFTMVGMVLMAVTDLRPAEGNVEDSTTHSSAHHLY